MIIFQRMRMYYFDILEDEVGTPDISGRKV